MVLRAVHSDVHGSLQRQSDEFSSALGLLNAMIHGPHKLLDPDERATTRMVYTHGVTLWMLILQRLGGGKSLNEVVSQIVTQDRDLLPDNKRVQENTLSENSAAYAVVNFHAHRNGPLTLPKIFR